MRTLLLALSIAIGLMDAADPPAPSFEVASIKLNHSGTGNWGLNFGNGRFIATNAPLSGLIKAAYRLKNSQLVGAPGWSDSEHYDIQAKIGESDAGAMRTMNREQQRDQNSVMLQALLVDRFKLALRHETRELPVYILVGAKNGPKLKETSLTPAELAPPTSPEAAAAPRKNPHFSIGRGQLTGVAMNLDTFADALSGEVGRVVLNQTGLKGIYDLELKWTPDENAAQPSDASGPSLFTAIQEQLGLKLEAQKRPSDVVVIDHIERPSEN